MDNTQLVSTATRGLNFDILAVTGCQLAKTMSWVSPQTGKLLNCDPYFDVLCPHLGGVLFSQLKYREKVLSRSEKCPLEQIVLLLEVSFQAGLTVSET